MWRGGVQHSSRVDAGTDSQALFLRQCCPPASAVSVPQGIFVAAYLAEA